MKNIQLGTRTVADIDAQVVKVLRGLGNPEPPIDLAVVRDLLRLDRQYYSTTDDGLLRETVSKLKVAGLQILMRPTLLREAVQSLSLKALYLPDQKRILIDKDLPKLKHRWNEAHEVGHDIIPWHEGMMLGIRSRRSLRLATQSWKPKQTTQPGNCSSSRTDSAARLVIPSLPYATSVT